MSMTPEQFNKYLQETKKHLEETVSIAIEKNVNGKIRNLDTKVTDYIKEDVEWKKKDTEWKANAQPSVSLGSKVISFTDGLKYILATGVALAGFILAIKTITGLFK